MSINDSFLSSIIGQDYPAGVPKTAVAVFVKLSVFGISTVPLAWAVFFIHQAFCEIASIFTYVRPLATRPARNFFRTFLAAQSRDGLLERPKRLRRVFEK